VLFYSRNPKQLNDMSTWRKTKVANLLRHRGGRYYGRFHIGGKAKFIALKTDVFAKAKLRLAEHRAEIERGRLSTRAVSDGTCTMGDLLRGYLDRLEANTTLSKSTRNRYREHVEFIRKTWPGFDSLRPENVTVAAVEGWRNRALTDGTGYTPPGAKSSRFAGNAPGTFNKSVDKLRHLLDAAVEAGAIARNPILRRGIKAKERPTKPTLPDSAKLQSIFADVEAHGGLFGKAVETADFLRFLAFTGCRLKEAGAVRWNDVDEGRGFLRVHGTKTDAAGRDVPLIPEARALLHKIKARRERTAKFAVDGKPQVDTNDRVLAVREAQKSLDRACKAVGVERLTHHSLRDVFATISIEAGVDIPTVAAWLGHADGGALLMKTYAAHRRAHSVAQAAKVNFGGAV
jgi:integrase